MTPLGLFSSDPKYETERLLIRKLLPRDAKDMYDYASMPETSKYLLWEPHPSLLYTSDLIHFLQKEYLTGKYSDLAIILKESEKMIGTVGFTSFDEKNRVAEVGYVISPHYWHQGIATEALSVILNIAFCEFDVRRVEAKYIPENVYSQAVMKKCGMTYEGTARSKMLIKGVPRDIAYCSILRDEYLAVHGDGIRYKTEKTSVFRRFFEHSHKN